MPLVIYGLGGVHTHTHARTHALADESNYKKPGTRLVSRSQTHYALASLLDGALAVKGLGTYAWPARARGIQLNERIK